VICLEADGSGMEAAQVTTAKAFSKAAYRIEAVARLIRVFIH
jgi:hypothetical protein